jgi:hypothetical protein
MFDNYEDPLVSVSFGKEISLVTLMRNPFSLLNGLRAR